MKLDPIRRRTFLLALALAACTPPTASQPINAPKTTPADVATVVSASNTFAASMYGQLRQSDGNLAFSPASIALALNMTRAGARGETARQMAETLAVDLDGARGHAAFGNLLHHWNSTEDRPFELRVANRLFGEQSMPFKKPFLGITADYYAAELEKLSFIGDPDASRVHINEWVEGQTDKRITNLLKEGTISPATRLVLTNAVYFKGKWKTEFDKDETRDVTFYAPKGEVKVPMMQLASAEVPFVAADGMRLIELPYKGEELAMTLILPDARDGLGELEANLTAERLDGWIKSASVGEVDVDLPRFKIDPPEAISLKDNLIKLGMSDAFDAKRADFSGMAARGLFISDAVHKAFVEVNEEGTEAAAATGVIMKEASIVQTRAFKADHPFLFLIRDTKTGAILFMGRVNNPAAWGKGFIPSR